MNAFHFRSIALVFFFFTFKLSGADQKLSLQDLESALVGKTFTLLQAQNVAAKQYYQIREQEFLFRHKLTGLFPNRQNVSDVAITRVRQVTETNGSGRNGFYLSRRLGTETRRYFRASIARYQSSEDSSEELATANLVPTVCLSSDADTVFVNNTMAGGSTSWPSVYA